MTIKSIKCVGDGLVTASQENYATLLSLSYSHTDIFLLCYSIILPSSYSQ